MHMPKEKRVWLREKRKANNLTLKALSEKVECSENHLCDIENGKKNPSFKLAFKISQELKFDIENFFHETVTA
jgi:transcriptional regulator with XRE-family HTH domain